MSDDDKRNWRDMAIQVWERMFPERQFYYRSRGLVRYVSLNGIAQSSISIVVLAFFGWVTFASVYLLFKNEIIDAKNIQIAKMEHVYEDLSSRLLDTEERFTAMTSDLEKKHKQLFQMITLKNSLDRKLGAISQELQDVSQARDQALEIQRNLDIKLALVERDLSGTSNERNSLSNALNEALSRVGILANERDKSRRSVDALNVHVDGLQYRLAGIKTSQRELISRLHERAALNVSEMEEVIKITKLDTKKLLKNAVRAATNAQGGPYILVEPPSGPQFAGMAPNFENSVTALEADLGRWELLQNIVQSLPLTTPIDNFRVSSGYGRRKDPITKRWASHHGLDLAGVFKSRVRATAAGVVTFAGRNGPLGRMIEVDHGFGLKTRYGHLHRILVKKGQRVDFRSKIGLMGSTGRSTGPHVHYEVIFNKKTRDPAKFLKAGRYVFKSG